MKRLVAVALSAALIVSLTGAAYAQTFITVQTVNSDLGLQECLDKADRAIRQTGWDVPGTTEYARHGLKGQYTIQIFCSTDKGEVIFVTAGANPKNTERYIDEAVRAFQ